MKNKYFVYLLKNGDKVVYVGMTCNLKIRMYAHSTKRHNNVEIIPFDNKTDALRSEQKHISLYSPKHNGRQGRPKLSKKEKKIIFSFKIKPELRDRINKKTKGVNRSAHVEKVLNDNY